MAHFALATTFAVAGTLLLAGCATVISPQPDTIHPTSVPLASFKSYALQPLKVARSGGDSGDQLATTRIETDLRGCLRATLRGLREEDDRSSEVRRLVVAPEIIDLKKVDATERRWAGPFAGSSAVLLKLTLRDSDSGQIVAEPVFHARGDAWAGSFPPFAAADEAMLNDIVAQACRYAAQNLRENEIAASPGLRGR